jgi:hypothetical protein
VRLPVEACAVLLGGVFVPLLLLILAVLTAGVVAYGTNAVWAQFPHGIGAIIWSRRLEWPLVTICLILCLILLALIVSGKRRAWWLIGLGPVLALFVHRFVTDPAGGMTVLDNPTFVSPDEASDLTDGDYIVGFQFGDSVYACPYATVFEDPVVIQSDHEKRLMLMWSPFANRAVAQTISREIKARDLEVVSMPANALLLYNRANGQFINGLKGQLPSGGKPIGFGNPVVASTMTWRQWRELNPQTKVMRGAGRRANLAQPAPREPILPLNPMPPAILDYPANSSIVLVGTRQPAAVNSEQVGPEPLRLQVDGEPVFVFREAPGMPVKAFSCYLKKMELFPRFRLDREHKYKGAMFIDSDTNSGWSASGVWVGGLKEYRKELAGARLAPIPVQDHLYWGVMKFWYPDLKLASAQSD